MIDAQQFPQYQYKEQPTITSHINSLDLKKNNTSCEIGNTGPVLGHAHKCSGLN